MENIKNYLVTHVAKRRAAHLEMVTRDGTGSLLQIIPVPLCTPELYLAACRKNGHALEYVPEESKSYELCKAAVLSNGYAFKHVPDKFHDVEMCIAVLKGSAVPCLIAASSFSDEVLRSHDLLRVLDEKWAALADVITPDHALVLAGRITSLSPQRAQDDERELDNSVEQSSNDPVVASQHAINAILDAMDDDTGPVAYALQEAVIPLANNWIAALGKGSKDELATEISVLVERLQEFQERIVRVLPFANGGWSGQPQAVWLEYLAQVGVSVYEDNDDASGIFVYSNCDSDIHATIDGALRAALLKNPSVIEVVEALPRGVVEITSQGGDAAVVTNRPRSQGA